VKLTTTDPVLNATPQSSTNCTMRAVGQAAGVLKPVAMVVKTGRSDLTDVLYQFDRDDRAGVTGLQSFHYGLDYSERLPASGGTSGHHLAAIRRFPSFVPRPRVGSDRGVVLKFRFQRAIFLSAGLDVSLAGGLRSVSSSGGTVP
jgi:hypothetical protein